MTTSPALTDDALAWTQQRLLDLERHIDGVEAARETLVAALTKHYGHQRKRGHGYDGERDAELKAGG